MATVSRTPWQLGDSGLFDNRGLIVSLSFQSILELMADLLPQNAYLWRGCYELGLFLQNWRGGELEIFDGFR